MVLLNADGGRAEMSGNGDRLPRAGGRARRHRERPDGDGPAPTPGCAPSRSGPRRRRRTARRHRRHGRGRRRRRRAGVGRRRHPASRPGVDAATRTSSCRPPSPSSLDDRDWVAELGRRANDGVPRRHQRRGHLPRRRRRRCAWTSTSGASASRSPAAPARAPRPRRRGAGSWSATRSTVRMVGGADAHRPLAAPRCA